MSLYVKSSSREMVSPGLLMSLYMKSSSREMVSPGLLMSLYMKSPIKFLGLIISVPKDTVSAKAELKSQLQSMLTAVDEAPPTHQETESRTLQFGNLFQVELASQYQ